MEKTKLGISVGALGAVIYLAGLINGLLLVTVIAGYILLKEENSWLKKTAVSAFALTAIWAILPYLIGIIPDFINMLDSFVGLFGGNITAEIIPTVCNILKYAVGIAEVLVMTAFAIAAYKKKTPSFPSVNSIVEKLDNA